MAGENTIFDGSVEAASSRQNSIGGLTIRTTAPTPAAGGIESGMTFPTSPDDGDLFNIIGSTDANIDDALYRYDGTNWIEIGSGTGRTETQVNDQIDAIRTSDTLLTFPTAGTFTGGGGGTTNNFFGSIIETFRALDAGFRYYCFLSVDSTSGADVTWEIVLNRVDRNQSPRVLQASTGDGTNPLTGTGTVAAAQTAFGFYNTINQLNTLTWQ